MAQRVVIPRLGQTMTEGTVTAWHQEENAKVKPGDAIYELEYDKATATVEARKAGVLKRLVDEGAVVPIGQAVAVILEEGETLEAVLAQKTYTPPPPKFGSAAPPAPKTPPAPKPEKKKSGYTPPASFKCSGDCPKYKEYEADAVIIGGGPGGYVAAIRLGLLGKKAVLVEQDRVGGTCLNRGCIPTKALLHSAALMEDIAGAGQFGISAENVKFDLAAVNRYKQQVVDKLVRGVESLLKARKVEVISGTAVMETADTVRIQTKDGERKLTARSVIIASGSVPAMPPIPGIDGKGVMTSNEALELKSVPQSMVIIGGGVIGMEMGTIYSRLGCDVTVIEAMDEILPYMDVEAAQRYRRIVAKQFAIYTGAKVTAIEDSKKGKAVAFAQGGNAQRVETEAVLVCTGRKPNTQALGLEKIGVKTERGAVTVDENWKTNVDGVYCIGDANGQLMLAHASSAQGIDVADAIGGRDRAHGNKHAVIPSCVYTDPEIGMVGKTEAQLKAEGTAYKASRFALSANGRSLVLGKSGGFVKILSSEAHGEVLGVHIVGPGATELIGECALAMRLECTIEEIADTVHAHPTVGESIMEAAEAGLLGAIHSLK